MKYTLLTFAFVTLALNSQAAFFGHSSKSATGEFLITNSSANSTGAVISDDSVSLRNGLDISFQAKFGLNNGHSAEGLVFMLTKKKDITLGAGGGGIGYHGIDSSFAIEFDSYGNGSAYDDAGTGNTIDHIAVRINGLMTSAGRIGNNISINNISDNAYHTIRITYSYSAKTLVVYLDGTQQLSMVYDIAANVFSGKTAAYWGVSAATSTNAYSVTMTVTNSASVLPVKLINFHAEAMDQQVELSWSTASEYNAERFEILRSFDGINWEVIGSTACAGNSTTVKEYSFTDYSAKGRKAYYRLKQVDFDGRTEMFTVISAGKGTNADAEMQFFDMSGTKIFFGTKAQFLQVCETGNIYFSENGEKFSKQ